MHTFTEFTGLQYLKIDIASRFGLDKLDWEDRIQWVDEHESNLEFLVQEADEPALYFAGVQAYRATQQGKPTGYPISLDAASSGLQLLACLTGCEASAALCGVVPTGHREDAYTTIYGAMCDTIGDRAKISRAQAKDAVMTSLYGSTAVPKKHFGTGELLEVYYQTMESRAPGAWALNKALQQLWQPGALEHSWMLPDGFSVIVPVTTMVNYHVQLDNRPITVTVEENQGAKFGLSLSPNIVHSIDGLVVREMVRRCDFDLDHVTSLVEIVLRNEKTGTACVSHTRAKDIMVQRLWETYLESGYLSVRILDYLDEDNLGLVNQERIRELLLSLPVKPFKVLTNHDCFRVLPNYGNDLRRQYNRVLSDIAASDMLAYISSQITGTKMPVVKMGDISKVILETDYALC